MNIITLYGRVARFFLHRVVAAWFMVLGSLAGLMACTVLLPGQTIIWEGKSTSDLFARSVYVIFWVPFPIVGWVLWRTYHYKWMPSPEEDARAKNPWE